MGSHLVLPINLTSTSILELATMCTVHVPVGVVVEGEASVGALRQLLGVQRREHPRTETLPTELRVVRQQEPAWERAEQILVVIYVSYDRCKAVSVNKK